MQIWMFCSLKFSTIFFPWTAFSHNIVVWWARATNKKEWERQPVQSSGSCERRIWWALYRLNQTYEGRKWDYTRWKWKRAPNTNGFTSKAKSIQSNSIPKSICGKMMWRNGGITQKKRKKWMQTQDGAKWDGMGSAEWNMWRICCFNEYSLCFNASDLRGFSRVIPNCRITSRMNKIKKFEILTLSSWAEYKS